MCAKTSEVSHTQGFEQIYEDIFIRVYASPMLPQVSEDISIPIKRKPSDASLRSNSPKRLARDDAWGSDQGSLPREQFNFNPTSLRGAEADEWRSTIIRDMFPGRSEQAQPSTNADKDLPSGKGKHWVPRARRSQHRLPKFDGPLSTSVAYLVLGPEIRGKFDPAAADALGVTKRDRGKLTKGESVTVTVNGVESIVTPNMCIGKSETPTVGYMII
jgi:ribonuclease Z